MFWMLFINISALEDKYLVEIYKRKHAKHLNLLGFQQYVIPCSVEMFIPFKYTGMYDWYSFTITLFHNTSCIAFI